MNKRNFYLALFIAFISATILAQGNAPADIVAEVGDQSVTIKDIESYQPEMYYRFKEFNSMSNEGNSRGGLMDDDKERILNEVIDNKLIIKEAKASDLNNDPEFQAMVSNFEENLLINFYQEKVIKASIQPSEDEIRAEYDMEGRFRQPAMAKVIKIWSENEEKAKEDVLELKNIKEDDIENTRFQIEDMHLYKNRNEENGEMNDGTNSSDENLDPYMQMMLVLNDAEVGDIVGPIKQHGDNYITAKVIEKTPEGKTAFEKVKEDIKRELIQRKFNEVYEQKKKELRKKAIVTIYYENLDKVFE
ncbi:peptidyl-prolyl cis-trans isomerase [bacterium]|nr:peptidyl-prolyl cis-trans isomerase [bacterium]